MVHDSLEKSFDTKFEIDLRLSNKILKKCNFCFVLVDSIIVWESLKLYYRLLLLSFHLLFFYQFLESNVLHLPFVRKKSKKTTHFRYWYRIFESNLSFFIVNRLKLLRLMLTNICWSIVILLFTLISTQCDSDSLAKVLHNQDAHVHKSSAYKYSQIIHRIHQYTFKDMEFLSIGDEHGCTAIWLVHLLFILAGYFIVPVRAMRNSSIILMISLSLATGNIMSNIFLRLLPSLVVSKDLSSNGKRHHYGSLGLFILIGIFSSFIFEKFVRFRQGENLFYSVFIFEIKNFSVL